VRSEIEALLRPDLRGRSAYGAPQLDVPVRLEHQRELVCRAAGRRRRDHRGSGRPRPASTGTRTASSRNCGPCSRHTSRQTGTAVDASQVWAGNGSNEVLLHLLQAFGGPGRTALGFTPAYSMHPIITTTTGTTWVDGMRGVDTEAAFDLSAASATEQVRRHRPDVVFLCSPNNPTGTALGLDVVEAVIEAAPDALVIVDEAYAEFSRPGVPSALTLLTGRPRLVVTRTMSKAFALAGARLGYLAADPDLIDALRLVRMPYHLGTQTQAVALAALAHTELMLDTVDAIKAQRDRIVSELTAMGLEPVPSDANFVLFGHLRDSHAAWQALLDRGVLVRDVGIPGYLRVSAGTPEETSAFLTAMADLAPTHKE
jgi:histidinol-phosphate aminotransferase